MAEFKLTKNELRTQQTRLLSLQKYLPTLQLKKAMLQSEVQEARVELMHCERAYDQACRKVESFRCLLNQKGAFDPHKACEIKSLRTRVENIAGIEVPYFEEIFFEEVHYSLFDTPPWMDALILGLRKRVEAQARIEVAQKKIDALREELRGVTIKVNLFEKILIPRALQTIRKIKVFLGDQQLAAVSQAKAAKRKIVERKQSSGIQGQSMETIHAY